jgi:riboflavin synthase
MFTGIVESQGEIVKIENAGTNIRFWIKSSIANELKVDQSVSHDGVCLTIESITDDGFRVSAVDETLKKTNLSQWAAGRSVNLERAMILGGRLDGHLVQGHVDTTATCILRENKDGSWLYRFSFPKRFAHLVIEKGSIAVNGTSLTAFDVTDSEFSVAIIPYTFNHTGIKDVIPGTVVNIEFDMLGKYITRWKELDKSED